MALNDLIKKITDEANKKAAFMKQVIDDEIKKIKEEFKEKAEKRKKEIEQKAENHSVSIIKKAKTLAMMESRSEMLKKKRNLIDAVYQEIQDELEGMSSAEYTELITTMLRHVMKENSKGHLIVPVSRRKETEDAIKQAQAEFIIESETDSLKGGFVLTSDKIEINFSFSYLIEKMVRPATELEVANILFN